MPGSSRTDRDPSWAKWSDDRLLALRFCDLGLSIRGTSVERRVERLGDELERRGLRFRPYVWLSDEWHTPVGTTGFAVPFYLAHPRLVKLERRMMLEAEGSSLDECMKILRHETGHAIQNAYRLNRRKRWRELFGRSGQAYPETYQPRPYSKRFVLHIDSWYAQAHPDEDFAETFAVWLTPGSQWRKRYKGWGALKKLEYVDELMGEIARQAPPVRTRERVDELRSLDETLEEHYEARRAKYGEDHPSFYDRDLRRLFDHPERAPGAPKAARFLRRSRRGLRQVVAKGTGQYQYMIDRVLAEMIARCEELDLRASRDEDELWREAAVLLTVQTMNYLHSGRHQLAV